ncbi:hypothetical protein F511_41029 [Dorcoceras hygrometricum]|uniref:Splicing factor 3B subunit 1-like n=1 Tax=Dorcoceras hygrometricum TaxID=472368 RepID=A0A2Z7DBY9_9LAMI|nr:hypothetical protein F511_41029 [Dorcoceras hygrometricum]
MFLSHLRSCSVGFIPQCFSPGRKVVRQFKGNQLLFQKNCFAGTFELPLEGLTDMHEVPKDHGKQLRTSCKKTEMTFKFRLLNDILAKSVTMKAGSFDAVTHERFLMISAIHGGVPVNWGRLLFNIFKDMVTPNSKQARGYAVQICILLKNALDLELGESKEFPPLNILTAKNCWHVCCQKQDIFVDVDEPAVEKPAEKKKAMSKKRPATTVEAPVVKRKKTTTGRAAPEAKILALVTVAQEVVPIQMVSVVTPPTPKRKAPKRKLKLPVDSDDEIVETEPDVVSGPVIITQDYSTIKHINTEA